MPGAETAPPERKAGKTLERIEGERGENPPSLFLQAFLIGSLAGEFFKGVFTPF